MTKSSPKTRAERRRLQREAEKELRRQVKQVPLAGGGIITRTQPDEVKMSEVLEAFVAPYRDSIEDKASYEKLLTLAALGWNMALMPHDKGDQLLNATLENVPGMDEQQKQDMRQIVRELVAYKQQRFPDFRRMIIKFTLEELDDGDFYLSVASTAEPVGTADESGEDAA